MSPAEVKGQYHIGDDLNAAGGRSGDTFLHVTATRSAWHHFNFGERWFIAVRTAAATAISAVKVFLPPNKLVKVTARASLFRKMLLLCRHRHNQGPAAPHNIINALPTYQRGSHVIQQIPALSEVPLARPRKLVHD